MVAAKSAVSSFVILLPLLLFLHPSFELPLFRRADRAVQKPIVLSAQPNSGVPLVAPDTLKENNYSDSSRTEDQSGTTITTKDEFPPEQNDARSSKFSGREKDDQDDFAQQSSTGTTDESERNPDTDGSEDDDGTSSVEEPADLSPAKAAPDDPWALPSTPSHLFYTKHSKLGNTLAAKSWIQPDVITSFARLFHRNESLIELAVFTTGVTMGSFHRDFNGTHCLVSNDMYPVVRTEVDVFYCIVSRHIQIGEPISLVIALDDKLEAALDGPVQLRHRLLTEMEPSRIRRVPEEARLVDVENETAEPVLPGGRDSYRILNSKHTMLIDTNTLPKTLQDYAKKARYETCILAPVKLTSHLLLPWVDYHRRIGIDHVFILDNDDPTDVAGAFAGRPDVDVLYWPFAKSQSQHLTFALMWTRHYCRSLHICDSDEYMMFGLGKNMQLAGSRPLTGFVRRRMREGYNGIFFPYLMMSHSGTLERPTKPPPEVYVHRAKKRSKNIKSTMFLDFPWTISTLHLSRGWMKARNHFLKNFTYYPVHADDRPVEVHFWRRSYEEMVTKRNHGSGDITDNQAVPTVKEIPDYNNPPEEYQVIDEDEKFTYFRTLWREITKRASLSDVNIVRETEDGFCARVYNWEKGRYMGKARCGDELIPAAVA